MTKMMSRLLVAFVLLSLAACGGGGSPSGPTPGPTATPTPTPTITLEVKSSWDGSPEMATVTVTGATPGSQAGTLLTFNNVPNGAELTATAPTGYHTHQSNVRSFGAKALFLVPNDHRLPGLFINELFYKVAVSSGAAKPLYKIVRREAVIVLAQSLRDTDTVALLDDLVKKINGVTGGSPSVRVATSCASSVESACVNIEERSTAVGFMTTSYTLLSSEITAARISVRSRNDLLSNFGPGALFHELGHAVLGFGHLTSYSGVMEAVLSSDAMALEFTGMEAAAYNAVSKARWPGCKFPDDCRETVSGLAVDGEVAVCALEEIKKGSFSEVRAVAPPPPDKH